MSTGSPLVRLAVLLVGDREAAEDVVQDVFPRLHGKAPMC
ncbi:DNA-directed RNA polymerase specialized sigma24 family protein [Nonomuraea thailandensis]|uniref:DNA-directed RNA polymerase specialized sigma24 family protein n=1 Tax=Nonomuraea thailandensis TaxID=1188745 RepID=A0A9X2GGS7_9ACTN|nr:DNA-directed RNA polymerase specialized sigma24 family protein [Nonomuraea thailandensis]